MPAIEIPSASCPPTAPAAGRATRPGPLRGWFDTWPITGRESARLLAAYVTIVGVWTLVGLWFTDWAAPNAITDFDARVADAVVDYRTPVLDAAATWCAALADTYNKIVVSVVIFGCFLWRWRRWYEAIYVGLPVVFEASAFIVITYLVGRERPPVERLGESHVASSFPSGHVAAATVYAAVAVVVWKHTRAVPARVLAAVVAMLVPLLVMWARVHQGVHHVTDVVAGMLLGLVSLVVTDRVLRPHQPADVARPPA